MRRLLHHPAALLAAGLLMGAAARLLDLHTQILGELFSRLGVWILLGTWIAVYSPSRGLAMGNVLAFSLGMLLTYYAVAELTHGVYGWSYVRGWTLFALCTPPLAWLAWMAKAPGPLTGWIRVGIVLAAALSGPVLYESFRWYDFLVDGLLIHLLFFKKIDRAGG